MKLPIYKSDGAAGGEEEFADLPFFEDAKGSQALKEAIVAQAANARQGSASSKTRGEVRGGGKKPWRQKGTGRARHGSIRSPLWVGGGVVFGPRPRDYSKKINRKARLLAFRRALFERAEDGGLRVLESLEVSPAKTRIAKELLDRVAPEGSVLLVDDALPESALLAARNLPRVFIEEAARVSATDLCRFDCIVATRKGLETLSRRASAAAS